jgi:hypothetical protein
MCAECSQIVHCDVKAPNVLVRWVEVEGGWEACISDFGTTTTAFSVRALAPIMRPAEALFLAGAPTALCAVVGSATLDNPDYTMQMHNGMSPTSAAPEQLEVSAPCPPVALLGFGRSYCTDEFPLATLGLTRTSG